MHASESRAKRRQAKPIAFALVSCFALSLTGCGADDDGGNGGSGGAGANPGEGGIGGANGAAAGAGALAGYGAVSAGGVAGTANAGTDNSGGNVEAGSSGDGDCSGEAGSSSGGAGSSGLGGSSGIPGGGVGGVGAAGVGGGGGGVGGGGYSAPLAFVTRKLTYARYAVAYSAHLTATGGSSGAYAFQVSAGALPPGIVMSAAGVLSGKPTVEGDFTFAVTVSDSLQATAVTSFSLAVRRHRWLAYNYEEHHGAVETIGAYMADLSTPGFPVVAGGPAFSQDGSWLIRGSTINDVSWSSVGPAITIAQQVQWSPHSEWIVVKNGNGFAVVPPSNPTQLIPFEARATCSNFRWSPDDARVAYECDGAVQVFEADVPPDPPAAQEVAPGKLIGWGADDLLTFVTAANKLGYARFGVLAAPATELELAANALSITITAPALRRVVFSDSNLIKNLLVDFSDGQILSESNLIYSPGLTRFARWQGDGQALSVYSVKTPNGPALADVPATAFNGWSNEDDVLATSGVPTGQLRFTWLSSPVRTKFLAGASGPAIFGPGADWVFTGPGLAFLNQANPQLVTITPPPINNKITIAPNREGFAYWTISKPCLANVASTGLGAPVCTQVSGGEESSPILWSSDSTAIAFRTLGYMPSPMVMSFGLWAMDAQNPSNGKAVVEGYSGTSSYQSLLDPYGFQP